MVRMPRQTHVQGGEQREHVIDEYRMTGSNVEYIIVEQIKSILLTREAIYSDCKKPGCVYIQ
jgi:hypothetical protein